MTKNIAAQASLQLFQKTYHLGCRGLIKTHLFFTATGSRSTEIKGPHATLGSGGVDIRSRIIVRK